MEKLSTKISLIIAFAILILFNNVVFASDRVVDIDFVGLTKTNEAVLRKKISLFEGSPYSSQAVKDDIKSLFQTGFFSDVYVKKESVSGGVRLVFHVLEKGIIRHISFKGNKKVKEKDLLNAVTVREYNLLDERRLSDSVQAIRQIYEGKGYYLADIKPELTPLDTEKDELELVFRIKENSQVRIKRISFVGNKEFSDRKLAKKLKTKVKGFLSFVSGSGKFKDEKMEYDLKFLTYFYLSEGFIKIKVGRPQISLTRNKDGIYITIPIYEGPRYKVNSVAVSGDIITTKEELESRLELKKGETYNRQLQDKDQEKLTELYGDQAYAFASVFPQITTDDEAKTADVTYVVQRGPKIVIEKIDIKGNTITRDKVIRRELQVFENAPYSKSGVELSKKRLMQLGYFEDVNFSNPRGSREDRVVLVVDVKEKPTGSFSLGAGFSSLESFIFTASVQKDNFFGKGLRGSVAASISKLRQEFNLSVQDRYFLDTRWIMSANAFKYTSALNRDFDQRAFGGSLSFGREIFPFFDVSLGYNIEDVEVTNFSSQVPAFFKTNASGLTSSLLSQVSYDTRDNRIQTSQGMLHLVSSEYAGSTLGSDNDFWKLYAESRWFFKMPWRSVLKARGVFGYVKSLNNTPVPLFERFFMGGINTLRGYNQNTIGPVIKVPATFTGPDTDFVFGGNRMVMANLEYEVPIYDGAGLRGVIFVDAGQAYAEQESIDLRRIRANYGVGFRWLSPFGPLRFEWGFPIDKREGESFSVFNFSIGQSF